MSNLEYTLKELPSLLPLGIRTNMTQNNLLLQSMGDTIEAFEKSVSLNNPYYNKFYKHMKVNRLNDFINTTSSGTKHISSLVGSDYMGSRTEIEDGYIDARTREFFEPDDVKTIDRFTSDNMLNLYQEYFTPTGRFSDLAFLNTIGPVGSRIKANTHRTLDYVYGYQSNELREQQKDISCNLIIIDIGKNSNITIEETFLSNPALKLYNILYLVRDGSSLTLNRDFSPDTGAHVIESKVIQFPNSSFTINSIGGRNPYCQELTEVEIHDSCTTYVNGRYYVEGDAVNNVYTQLHHIGKSSLSRVDVKSVLEGNAHSSFRGEIVVDKSAEDTDADLKNNNLLCSSTATAISEPQLDINTKEIQCAHGCTVSNIDAEQLYFLQSRGISKQKATNILKESFLGLVL